MMGHAVSYFINKEELKMAVVLFILALIIGTVIYKISIRNSIGTTGAYFKRWLWCVGLTFAGLAILTGAV